MAECISVLADKAAWKNKKLRKRLMIITLPLKMAYAYSHLQHQTPMLGRSTVGMEPAASEGECNIHLHSAQRPVNGSKLCLTKAKHPGNKADRHTGAQVTATGLRGPDETPANAARRHLMTTAGSEVNCMRLRSSHFFSRCTLGLREAQMASQYWLVRNTPCPTTMQAANSATWQRISKHRQE